MSDMKCPFCQQELDMDMGGECGCPNEQCQKSVFMFGSEELWQELIRTRKALDVAVDTLKILEKELYFNNAKQTGHIADSVISIPSLALEQINEITKGKEQ